MSQEQPQRPVTYGDVFPNTQVQGQKLATEPVTMEDASLMQSAEALAFGRTQKGGAASTMQSAAPKNVDQGLVDRDAHSVYAEYGMGVSEVAVPGAVMDISYVAGNPVAGSAHPVPTDPLLAAMDAVTIGEALEAAAVGAGDKLVDDSDARAIQSAEARAIGISAPVRGGVAAAARSAAEINQRVTDPSEQRRLADILMDATTVLPADKVATPEDAEKVIQAELRGKSEAEELTPSGVGAAIAAAADLNVRSGIVPLPATGQDVAGPAVRVGIVEEVGKYYPVDSSTDARMTGGDEETATTVGLIHQSSSEEYGTRLPSDVSGMSTGGDEDTARTPLLGQSNSEQYGTQASAPSDLPQRGAGEGPDSGAAAPHEHTE